MTTLPQLPQHRRPVRRPRLRIDVLAELEGLWPALLLMFVLAVAMTSLRLL